MLTPHITHDVSHKLPLAPLDEERARELALVEALLDDQPAAWRSFNALYSRLIYRCITRVTSRFSRVVSQEDVREIYAIFCIQLLANDKAKLRSFEPSRGSRLSSWLGLLASHATYDFLRSRRREPRTEDVTVAVSIASKERDPLESCELRERAAIATELLASFSTKDQEFMGLYYGEGLTPETVATRMNISVKTVYTKKHKIQARLEALLQKRQIAA